MQSTKNRPFFVSLLPFVQDIDRFAVSAHCYALDNTLGSKVLRGFCRKHQSIEFPLLERVYTREKTCIFGTRLPYIKTREPQKWRRLLLVQPFELMTPVNFRRKSLHTISKGEIAILNRSLCLFSLLSRPYASYEYYSMVARCRHSSGKLVSRLAFLILCYNSSVMLELNRQTYRYQVNIWPGEIHYTIKLPSFHS